MTIEQEVAYFEKIVKEMTETFKKKRHDYGQTTTETFQKFGPISMLTRMHDKLGRLDNLLGANYENAVEESVYDTLLDLANYAIITVIELTKTHM